MNKLVRPSPLDREIKLGPSKVTMSKINPKGTIEYTNDYFMDICAYKKSKLI
jgi:hypothetical protein